MELMAASQFRERNILERNEVISRRCDVTREEIKCIFLQHRNGNIYARRFGFLFLFVLPSPHPRTPSLLRGDVMQKGETSSDDDDRKLNTMRRRRSRVLEERSLGTAVTANSSKLPTELPSSGVNSI